MKKQVTDVILGNGLSIHVFGTTEELRTKFEAALDMGVCFLEVETEGTASRPVVPITLNLMTVVMMLPNHDQQDHGAGHGGSGEPMGHVVL